MARRRSRGNLDPNSVDRRAAWRARALPGAAACLPLYRRAQASRVHRRLGASSHDEAALAIHVPRPHPVRESVVGPVLAPPFWRRIEIPVDAEELFAAAPIRGVGVEDLAGVVLDEDPVAGQVLEPRIHVLVVIEGAARGDLVAAARASPLALWSNGRARDRHTGYMSRNSTVALPSRGAGNHAGDGCIQSATAPEGRNVDECSRPETSRR